MSLEGRNCSSIATDVRKVCKWQPPQDGFLKFNVDGTMFSELKKAGIGLVLRDSRGAVVMATTVFEREVYEPATIELVVVLRGLQLCFPLRIPKLAIESDYLLLVQALQTEYETFSSNGNLLKGTKALMSYFQEVCIDHVNRMGNGVSYTLVRYAWNVSDVQTWWGNVPNFVDHSFWFDQVAM
ncbi:uncharacterized protein LOC122310130 [Carya illinoinensis]|uniref:uncharacterized protein LOC122310130 n=1 Tax=Carya illinoinensis TaxID=32201 RepID=UPI001C722AD3|nr:uncharacterized protein LOC122310130 [Carya illinoinensis]